jgi:hypothetical protein
MTENEKVQYLTSRIQEYLNDGVLLEDAIRHSINYVNEVDESNFEDLINKVRYYKRMYSLQKAFTKKVVSFLKFLTQNNNNFISNSAKDFLNDYFTEFKNIKQIKNK